MAPVAVLELAGAASKGLVLELFWPWVGSFFWLDSKFKIESGVVLTAWLKPAGLGLPWSGGAV